MKHLRKWFFGWSTQPTEHEINQQALEDARRNLAFAQLALERTEAEVQLLGRRIKRLEKLNASAGWVK